MPVSSIGRAIPDKGHRLLLKSGSGSFAACNYCPTWERGHRVEIGVIEAEYWVDPTERSLSYRLHTRLWRPLLFIPSNSRALEKRFSSKVPRPSQGAQKEAKAGGAAARVRPSISAGDSASL